MREVNIWKTNLEFGALENRQATNKIVIHQVGGANRDFTAKELHGWHIKQGWAGIGYHFVIRKDGTIEEGRPHWVVGSHAYGHNWDSIGINFAGDFDLGEPTPEQIESGALLLAKLCSDYGLAPDANHIVGHCDLMATACPGRNLYKILQTIRGKAVWYQQN